jgi:hypothetical protein
LVIQEELHKPSGERGDDVPSPFSPERGRSRPVDAILYHIHQSIAASRVWGAGPDFASDFQITRQEWRGKRHSPAARPSVPKACGSWPRCLLLLPDGPNTMQTFGTEGPKRDNTTPSCAVCQRRKVKCNRVYPCAPCQKTGLECHFNEVVRHRAKRQKRTHVPADADEEAPAEADGASGSGGARLVANGVGYLS